MERVSSRLGGDAALATVSRAPLGRLATITVRMVALAFAVFGVFGAWKLNAQTKTHYVSSSPSEIPAFPTVAGAPAEPCAVEILSAIEETRAALLAAHPKARFLTFWDCDGTILKGDCSEGLTENGQPVYPGLAQLSIEHGLSKTYPASGGFAEFWKDYRYLDERMGHGMSYPYLVQMLAGSRADEVESLARGHFEHVLAPYVFSTARDVLAGLKRNGVENHIITASSERFVRGGAGVLGVPKKWIHGIRVREADGLMTSELIYPLTVADGKRVRLEEILAAERAATPDRPVFVLTAFGNSYGTDGAFLAWTAKQSLPAGSPVAVMFNGGEEKAVYRGLFLRREINAVVGR